MLGEMGWGDYKSDTVPGYAQCPKNQLMTWDYALPFLTYEFDDGYGAPGCQAVTAWTANKVIIVVQYDGSTSPFSVPRNPISHIAEMPGG